MENLIHGKSQQKKVVCIEPGDEGTAELFVQGEDGAISSVFIPYRLWCLSNENLNGGFQKLDGNLHYKFGNQFETKKDFYQSLKKWKNKDTYTIKNPQENLMTKDGICYYRDLELKDLSVLSFDIETTGLNPEAPDARTILISNTFRRNNCDSTLKVLFSYDQFDNEAAMLEHWASWVKLVDPSVITNHNVFGFDLNYLIKRAEITGAKLRMGRDDSELTQANYTSKFRIDGSRDMEYFNVRCYGREIIDTYFLSIRHDVVAKKYENYKLKSIIKAEGLEKADRTFYDASLIRHNYKDPVEFEKIKTYCMDDSDDALALFDLMAPPFFYLTQSTTRGFQHVVQSATGALINGMLVRSYLQDKHSIPKASELEKLEGGISFGIPGVYKNVKKWDLKSAYPSQILRFKLFDKNKDPKGHFYKLVKHFTEERFYLKKMSKETGDPKWEARDRSGKILINSAYGTCSTNGLNFNSPILASRITLETRNVIDMALKWSSGKDRTYWIELFKETAGGNTGEDEEFEVL